MVNRDATRDGRVAPKAQMAMATAFQMPTPSRSWPRSGLLDLHRQRGARLGWAIRMAEMFVYAWVYEVYPGMADEFREMYGPDGPWVALFRQAPGYLDTQLLRDRNDQTRFMTIDRWHSEDAFARFRANFRDQFEHLDRLGEQLTLTENPLGEFEPLEQTPSAGWMQG